MSCALSNPPGNEELDLTSTASVHTEQRLETDAESPNAVDYTGITLGYIKPRNTAIYVILQYY